MPRKNSTQASTPITSLTHADKRANIPTEELRDFVADEERNPKAVFYPRDPSLDPQLVWKGKDEQDSRPLEVQSVPIYIQEKVSPQAIIENVRAHAREDRQAEGQLALFADFNNIDFSDLVDFYHHEQNWTNRMILGDSLLVMTSLAEKEGLKGRVQMVYIDPPYGIKFGSNWQVSTRKRDVQDGKAADATRQPEQIKAFRDTWQVGIHSYLAYLRDRLVVARELLTESGSIFVQINSENSHLVACIMDEVLGSENFVANIIFRKKSLPLGSKHLETMHDHILFYAKDKEQLKYRQLFDENDVSQISSHGPFAFFSDGSFAKIDVTDFRSKAHPQSTQYYRLFSTIAPSYSQQTDFDYEFEGNKYKPPSRGAWVVDRPKLDRIVQASRLQVEGSSLSYRLFFDDFPYKKLTNFWLETAMSYEKIYVVQTTPDIIARCLLMTTDPGDLVIDPTCGSGTTAYVAEQWGRRWITVDTSRVSIALARTRLMAGRFPYYLLADSPEGAHKEADLNGQLPPSPLPTTASDVKKGFVYKRVPHVTLKTIANNEEIDSIHTKWQERLKPKQVELNTLLGQAWEEWQIPLKADPKWLEKATGLHAEWMRLRRERQNEIDASISRRADTEQLYDQPFEDNKRIRVTGPFTVESLSPHRVLSTDEERPASEVESQQQPGPGQFESMIIDNLRAAGVQNTIKNERLKFTRLEPYAGIWLHAKGEYTEKDGALRRVAITIGPEHGTVGPDLIKDAAKEAVQGIGFDLLVVCGFAFDPHVSEEIKRYGKLTVLPTRINPDLQMGGTLLKNTGYGNLFMVFGEPDVTIQTFPDGKIALTIKGVDVYDPTTGEIRSSSTDDIACWFVDTNYNGESFFVRHAYFTGADEPYEKLKRALRAEIDEAAWSALYSTTSYPFDKPETGKIAVKVINHYGDEVLKVYPV